MLAEEPSHFANPVLAHTRAPGLLLRETMTIEQAIATIRTANTEDSILYFYVTDEDARLRGVLPTRSLLSAQPETRLSDVMQPRVLTIPHTATLLEACELFILHKFLAFPVVDDDRHIVGLLDIGVFTQEVLGLAEQERPDQLFEALGLRVSQLQNASPLQAFRGRFPWLLTTIGSGTLAAMIAGHFETTLANQVLIAFFLALVLALAESVSMQSLTLTMQALRATMPTARWFRRAAAKEFMVAVLLGAACGLVVFCIVWLWRGQLGPAAVIGTSVAGSLLIACLAGLSVPSLLHALRLDPKIAAAPATLAITDVLTLLLYLSLARWWL